MTAPKRNEANSPGLPSGKRNEPNFGWLPRSGRSSSSPCSAWGCRLRRSASSSGRDEGLSQRTRSVQDGIPTKDRGDEWSGCRVGSPGSGAIPHSFRSNSVARSRRNEANFRPGLTSRRNEANFRPAPILAFVAGFLALVAWSGQARAGGEGWKFDLGPGPAAPGFVKVPPETLYSKALGHGFEPGSKVEGVNRNGTDPLRDDFVTGPAPFFFSVVVPEGNYRVRLTLGDREGESATTVKAESRRLMVEDARTARGSYVVRTFLVNMRTPTIASEGSVKLASGEASEPDWDDKLTLEFNGPRPCVCGIEIEPAPSVTTVFVVGDSTVTDQSREPYNSWGQMLPRFFTGDVCVSNHARSGAALRSFVGSRRLAKVLDSIRPGDYLLVQFGHNDQKEKGEGVGAFTTYAASLRSYIAEARARKATPILVTPVARRAFDREGKLVNNLGEYPEAVRRVAREEGVPLVDLNIMTRAFYEALGVEGSKAAFVDNSHHNNYGSYEVARCVVEGLRQVEPTLAKWLDPAVSKFDPSRPDPLAAFRLSPSPKAPTIVPEGS